MRKIILLGLGLLGVAAFTTLRNGTKDATPVITSARVTAPGDSIIVIYRWVLPSVTDGRGAITGINARTTRTSPSPVTTVTRLNLAPAKLADTAVVPSGGLTVASTATGTVCLATVRRTLASAEKCANWSATFGDQPPPPVDSVVVSPGTQVIGLDVKPDAVGLFTASTQQFCAFAKLSDGKWYGTTNADGSGTATTPYCITNYAGWYPLTERTTNLQQAVWRSPIPIERNPLKLVVGPWGWASQQG